MVIIQTLTARSDPAPFSSFVPPLPHETSFQNRKSRSVFRLDPPACTLPPKKVFVPDPQSVPTAIGSLKSDRRRFRWGY